MSPVILYRLNLGWPIKCLQKWKKRYLERQIPVLVAVHWSTSFHSFPCVTICPFVVEVAFIFHYKEIMAHLSNQDLQTRLGWAHHHRMLLPLSHIQCPPVYTFLRTLWIFHWIQSIFLLQHQYPQGQSLTRGTTNMAERNGIILRKPYMLLLDDAWFSVTRCMALENCNWLLL